MIKRVEMMRQKRRRKSQVVSLSPLAAARNRSLLKRRQICGTAFARRTVTSHATVICYPNLAVRMIWWFLILGVSTLVVVCVAIALYVRLRRHLQKAHASHDGTLHEAERERQPDSIER